ncbi:hypothetical protein MPSEU_001071700 [Mayamaea pseudoterrestris]|nr:hypothetical protein MPSEU_001071700 [Mayamaea pseudoterrestris]
MSTQTMTIEPFTVEELIQSEYFPSTKPQQSNHHSLSTMMTLLSPKYQPTLEAVLKKLQATSTTLEEVTKTPKMVSFSADDIKIIAAEALRITNEQTIVSPITSNDEESNEMDSRMQLSQMPTTGTSCSSSPTTTTINSINIASTFRLNKFVRILHDMLIAEADSGIVEWRRGLLVLHSTDMFAKTILPKYFNTRNFKTFRRQLNYYGFVHVRSFSTTGSATTALWVNRELAQSGTNDIASVLLLRRVEPDQVNKTAEGRRVRKEQAIHTVEDDIGVNQKSLQMEQIRSTTMRRVVYADVVTSATCTAQTVTKSLPTTACTMDSSSGDNDENASAANLLLLLSRS